MGIFKREQFNPGSSGGKVTGSGNGSQLWRPVALIAVVLAILVLARVFGLGSRLVELRDWISGMGQWGILVFIAIYVAATVVALPGSALSVVAGAVFGSLLGVIAVSVASTVGAGLSFLVSRYFARDAVAKWLAKKGAFQKLDRMTEEHGAVIVALTRLVPVFPFNLLNYGFGLTRVRFWTYLFWSWVCMLPGTIFYVAGADAVFKGISEGRVPWSLMAVVVAALAGLILVVRFAKRKLDDKSTDS